MQGGKWYRRIGWFAVYWIVSVAVLGLVAFLIRLAIG